MIPEDCDLTVRSPGIPAWDEVDPALKPALARQMEVYAGYLANTDHHVGLLISALEDLQILNDTLIYLIIGENGASAEGSLQGTFNEMITLGGFGALETPEFMSSWTPRISGPSRSPPTGAGPATAPSSTGHAGSRPRARSARSSTTSSTSPRPSWRWPGCPTR